jgi:arylsulfatase A-like enzyme
MSMISRRSFMKQVGVAVGVAGVSGCASLTPSRKRPNIVFIFTDDHGRQAISAYGSRVNKTPNIDRIADEGLLFNNCLVTNSICGPSRAVIQTGKHSHINGFWKNGLTFDGSQQTFPKLLRNAGYETAMIGKWHLKSLPTGFDFYEVLKGQGPYYNPPMVRNGEEVKHTGYTTDIITDITLDWLKTKRDPDKPFMLMTQHKAPHRNWQPGPKYLNKYDGETIPEPSTLFDDWSGRGSASAQQAMTIEHHMNPNDLKLTPPRGFTEEQAEAWNKAYKPKNEAFEKMNLEGKDLVKWKYQRYVKDYIRCVDSVDENIGRLLEYLDETGLADNTVVIYSSDQGWYLGDHGWFDKRWMYEESLQMPLVARWPGVIKKGAKTDALVSNLDFAETFLDIAGVEVPGDMQGRSMTPIMKGQEPADWPKSFYYQYWEYPDAHQVHPHYGVRTKTHKLIRFPLLDEWELYDLEKDPEELTSVYGKRPYAKVTETLKKELERLRKQYQAPERSDVYPDGMEYREPGGPRQNKRKQ